MGWGIECVEGQQNLWINSWRGREVKAFKEENPNILDGKKVLTLGAGGSGKTTLHNIVGITFNKEVRIMHNNHANGYILGIRRNIAEIIDEWGKWYITTSNDGECGGKKIGKIIDDVSSIHWDDYDNMDNVKKMALLVSPFIQSRTQWLSSITWSQQTDINLLNVALLSEEHLLRMCSEAYHPSLADVVLSRFRTTGIRETDVMIPLEEMETRRIRCRLVDVGGPRSERKKWMHCFLDLSTLIFCINLAEVHCKLYEDENVLVRREVSKLLSDLVDSRWFADTKVVVIGTHYDQVEYLWKFPLYRRAIEATGCPEDQMRTPARYAEWVMHKILSPVARAQTKQRIVVFPAISLFAPRESWLLDLMRLLSAWPQKLATMKYWAPEKSAAAQDDNNVLWLVYFGLRYHAAITLLLIRKNCPQSVWRPIPVGVIRMVISFLPRDYPGANDGDGLAQLLSPSKDDELEEMDI